MTKFSSSSCATKRPSTSSQSTIGQPAPKYQSVEDVATHLDVCTKTVRRLIKNGELPAYRFDNQLRIADVDLKLYIEKSRIRL